MGNTGDQGFPPHERGGSLPVLPQDYTTWPRL